MSSYWFWSKHDIAGDELEDLTSLHNCDTACYLAKEFAPFSVSIAPSPRDLNTQLPYRKLEVPFFNLLVPPIGKGNTRILIFDCQLITKLIYIIY